MLAQKPPDRCGMGDNASGGRQGSCEFRQSDVTVLGKHFFKQQETSST
jgi:hypothetical protein